VDAISAQQAPISRKERVLPLICQLIEQVYVSGVASVPFCYGKVIQDENGIALHWETHG
jgi:hypothetical protein